VNNRNIILLKVAVWIACLAPLLRLAALGWNSFHGKMPDLGANPIEFITLNTGTNTLVFLLISLAITPVRRITSWNWLIRFRRLLGLFAFFYGCLHLMTYVWLDQDFEWKGMVKDIMKRPFITMGLLAFALMVPLAVTSTAWAIRKMGGKNWNKLHRLVYISAICAIIHFWWKVKADISEPLQYAAVLAILLLFRVGWAVKEWLKSRKTINAT